MTQTDVEPSGEVQSVERPAASVPVGQRVKSIIGFHRISRRVFVDHHHCGLWVLGSGAVPHAGDAAFDRLESVHHSDPCPWCARGVVDRSD